MPRSDTSRAVANPGPSANHATGIPEDLPLAIEELAQVFVLFDADDRIVVASRAWRELNREVPHTVVPGTRFEDNLIAITQHHLVPEAVGREREWLAERLERHRNPTGPFEMCRRDGRWVLVFEQRLASGGTVLTMSDITERKRAEQALAEREAMVEAVSANLPGSVYRRVLHPDGRIDYPFVSKSLHSVLGIETDLIKRDSRALLDSFHPDDRACWQNALAESARTLTPFNCEVRVADPLGGYRWMRSLASPHRLATGEVIWDGLTLDITEEKEAEEALRSSEERLRNLIEGSVQALLVMRGSQLVFCNATAVELFGYADTTDLLALRSLGQLFCAQDVERLVELVGMSRDDDLAPREFECRGRRLDGRPVWLEARVRSVVWGNDHAIQMTAVDVTERKRAEQELVRHRDHLEELVLAQTRKLRESEQRFKAVIDNSPAPIYLKDNQGRYLLVNQRFLDWYCEDHAQVLGKTVHELGFALNPHQCTALDKEVMDSLHVIEREEEHVQGDGRRRATILTKFPVLDSDGRPIGVGGIDIDISARKRAEVALRESEIRFRAIADTAPLGIFIVRTETGEIIYNNRLFEFLLGYESNAFEGGEISRYYVLPSLHDEHVSELRRNQFIHNRELDLIRADGTQLVGMFSARLMEFAGEPAILGCVVEIGEMKRIQAELKAASVEAEARAHELEDMQAELIRSERLATLGQITATVSHELRNPLGTIRTDFYALRHSLGELNPSATRQLDRVERNIQRCVRIIDELLGYTRNSSLRTELVDIDHWIAELVTDIGVPDEVMVELHLETAAHVSIDPDRFRQVLVNVIQNAWQAILSEDTRTARGKLTVATERSRDEIMVRLTDNGCGIPDEIHEKIFEPLFSTKGFGVGLGLAVVKRVVDQHGGSIDVDSAPGRGTTVRIGLPLENG